MTYQLLLRAANFAADKHRFQRRKDDEASPYINHPLKVAEILTHFGGITDEQVLAAALLHDTIEDTETTADELEAEFGARVRQIVEEVTDDKTLPKTERKRLQVEHAAHLSRGAVSVKLADKIANVTDVTHKPPAGWNTGRRVEYLDWAEAVVNNGPHQNEALISRFSAVIAAGRRELM